MLKVNKIQIRKGPNKIDLMDIPQSFCEDIKLFTKELTFPLLTNYISYYFSLQKPFVVLFSFSLFLLINWL